MRKVNFFEILIVGFGVLVGFMIINNQADKSLSWELYQTVFLWLMLIVMLVLAAATEDVKEAIVISAQTEETKLLKGDQAQ